VAYIFIVSAPVKYLPQPDSFPVTAPRARLCTIKNRFHNFNIKLLFMIYKATCFDHIGGHHQAWAQDIIEEDYCQ
jgi:hypothetical protein